MGIRHAFLENVLLAAEVASVQILSGARISDRIVQGDKIETINSAIVNSFRKHYEAVVIYDPLEQKLIHKSGVEVNWLGLKEGQARSVTLEKVLDDAPEFSEVATLLIVEDGDFIFETPASPRERELALIHRLNRKCEQTYKTADGKNVLTTILKFRNSNRVPSLLTANPLVRQNTIETASRDERSKLSELSIDSMPQALRSPEAIDKLVAVTEDLQIDEILSIIELIAKKGQTLSDIEHIARGVRIGVTDSPWAGTRLRQALKEAGTTIEKRVKGQKHVITPTIQALKRAALNLSGAHTRSAQSPRLVLWLSGPTGTGKTELAKAIGELIFGDEKAVIRFDGAEFADAHSDARLIGAPPGYVGFEGGGELTEGVRQKPFCVILFDEIEKAHPRIMDKFLAILDDGRLTDGQGRTVNFSETIVIFTSNLGMAGTDYNPDLPFEALEQRVRMAVKDHFLRLGRPELLGRIGMENIIVYDYIRENLAHDIIEKMTKMIIENAEKNTGFKIDLEEEAKNNIKEMCLRNDVLELGGRGIANKLQTVLTNQLADALFEMAETAEKHFTLKSINNNDIVLQKSD